MFNHRPWHNRAATLLARATVAVFLIGFPAGASVSRAAETLHSIRDIDHGAANYATIVPNALPNDGSTNMEPLTRTTPVMPALRPLPLPLVSDDPLDGPYSDRPSGR